MSDIERVEHKLEKLDHALQAIEHVLLILAKAAPGNPLGDPYYAWAAEPLMDQAHGRDMRLMFPESYDENWEVRS